MASPSSKTPDSSPPVGSRHPPLRIALLGPLQVVVGGKPLPAKAWDRRQTPSLLKLLLTSPGKVFSSQEIIDLLWPALRPEAAAKSLRAAVSKLRKVLEPNLAQGRLSKYIQTDPAGYAFLPSLDCAIDTDRVRAELDLGKASQRSDRHETALSHYQTALSHFRGEFLSDEAESDWVSPARQHWRDIRQILQFSKGECHLALGQYSPAIGTFQEILRSDRCQEAAYRQLMLCHYLSGRFNEVALLFRQCGQALKDDLEVAPSEETVRLYEQIVRKRVPGIDQAPRVAIAVKRPPPHSLGRIEFVGREEEVGLIAGHLEEALSGKGGMIAVGGEPGIGKTRLAEEMLLYARSRSCLTAGGRCYSPEWRRPYEPFAEIFRQLLKGPGRDRLLALSPFWRACAAQIVPEFALDQKGPALPAIPLEQEKQRLFEAIIRLLLDLSKTDPLVLLFDDLHWADDETLQLLHDFVHRISPERILVLATYRTEEGAAHPLLVRLLAAIRRLSSRNLILPNLPTRSLTFLFRRMSPKQELPLGMERLALRIYRETHGNPLFMVELLQSLLEKGIFKVNRRGKWIEPDEEERPAASQSWEIPNGIRQVIRSRLERVPPGHRNALARLSTFGQGFTRHFFEKLLGPEESVPGTLEALLQLGFLQEEPQIRGVYRFAHENIRQTIYETLTQEEKREFHLRMAKTLEALNDPGRSLQEIGHQFFMAEAWPKAFHYLMQAAREAQSAYAFAGAILLLNQAEQILERHGAGFLSPADLLRERLSALKIKDYVLDGQGELKKREKVVAERIRLARLLSDSGELAAAYLALCGLHESNREWSEAADLARQALALYENRNDPAGMAKGYRELGYIYWNANQFENALEVNQKALHLHETLGNLSGSAGDLHNLGQVYTSMGDFEKGLEYYQKARTAFKKLGDNDARYLNIFSRIARMTGNLNDSLSSTLKAIESAHEAGHHFGEWHYLMNAASLWFTLGKRDQALASYEAAIEAIKKSGGNPGCQGHSLRGIGIIHQEEGNADRAAACFTEAAALLLESGELPAWAEVCRRLGDLMIRSFQDGEKALHYYRSALSHLRKEGPLEAVRPLLTQIGDAAWHCGKPEEAIPFYLEALEQAREDGNRGAIGASLAALGVVYRETGRLEEALESTLQAEEVARSLQDRAAEGYLASSLCETYLALGRLQEAEAAARVALEIRSTERSDPEPSRSRAWAHFRLGKVLLKGNKKPEGRAQIKKATALAGESGDRDLLKAIAALDSPPVIVKP